MGRIQPFSHATASPAIISRPLLAVADCATDTGSQIIVGADVTNAGTDLHELAPMCDQLERRYGRRPGEVLVDRGYVSHEGFEEVGGKGTEIYASVPVRRAGTRG